MTMEDSASSYSDNSTIGDSDSESSYSDYSDDTPPQSDNGETSGVVYKVHKSIDLKLTVKRLRSKARQEQKKYVKLDERTRVRIAKYAWQYGLAAACKMYEEKAGQKLSMSSIRRYRDMFGKSLEQGNPAGFISRLAGKQINRLKLGDLDQEVQEEFLEKQRAGKKLTWRDIVQIAQRIVRAHDPQILKENGGHMELSRKWAESFRRRMKKVREVSVLDDVADCDIDEEESWWRNMNDDSNTTTEDIVEPKPNADRDVYKHDENNKLSNSVTLTQNYKQSVSPSPRILSQPRSDILSSSENIEALDYSSDDTTRSTRRPCYKEPSEHSKSYLTGLDKTTKLEIGKYASKNGQQHTVNKYKAKLGITLTRSNIRYYKTLYYRSKKSSSGENSPAKTKAADKHSHVSNVLLNEKESPRTANCDKPDAIKASTLQASTATCVQQKERPSFFEIFSKLS